MLPRDTDPPGVPCWIDTAQPDVDAATERAGGDVLVAELRDPHGATFTVSRLLARS